MAVFNWHRFLDDHRIQYVTSGPNTRRGEVSVKCPMCGNRDPSEHMGISLDTGFWACWRNADHRGRKPHKLIKQLLGCTYDRASQIAGTLVNADPGSFASAADRLRSGMKSVPAAGYRAIPMPDKFRPIKLAGRTLRFAEYLVQRGFERSSIESLIEYYGLRCCTYGLWQNRIIFPVTMRDKLVNWQARSIHPQEQLRYMSLSTDPDRIKEDDDSVASLNIKDALLPYDRVLEPGGRILYVVEGPMDALKVDFYGRAFGVRAVCLFSLDMREEQMYLLRELKPHFERMVLMLDPGNRAKAMKLKSKLYGVIDGVREPPPGVEDPGALTPNQVRQMNHFSLV